MISDESANALKHDVNNQLSSITLCLEQLRFEVPNQNEDMLYYFDTIEASCKNITNLLATLKPQ